MSFPLRILCRAFIWCGESCSDAFEVRSSANFTESLKRSIANSIFPYSGMNISSDPSGFAVHESSCHEILANASDWLKRCELISIPARLVSSPAHFRPPSCRGRGRWSGKLSPHSWSVTLHSQNREYQSDCLSVT